MADTKTITIYGILGILIVSGLGVFLTPEQLDKAVTCTTNNVTGIFERLSSTNVTAYWTENGVLKQSVCSKGKWIPTREWLKLNSLSEDKVVLKPVSPSNLTEDLVEIVTVGQVINVDKSKTININGQTYNISYVPKIKCICDKVSGCKISECIS